MTPVEWIERDYDSTAWWLAPNYHDWWFYSFKGDYTKCNSCNYPDAGVPHTVGADSYQCVIRYKDDELIPNLWKAPCP